MVKYIKYIERQVTSRAYVRQNADLEKIVVKTAVKTVLAILIILVVVFAVFNFAFPQHMATFSESIGNYALAVKYSSLRYSYTGDSMDLARCFDDSVSFGNDDYIIVYGEELVAKEDFPSVCSRKEKEFYELNDKYFGDDVAYDYNQRVKGKLAVAYYHKGEGEKAVDFALAANGTKSFASGNAIATLYLEIKAEGDRQAAALMLSALNGVSPVNADEAQALGEVISSLEEIAAD